MFGTTFRVINTIPLKLALEEKSLALFIGADLSSTITGLASRKELAKVLSSNYLSR